MQIDTVTTNSFNGQIKLDKKIPKQKLKLINEVLDFKTNQKSARERIKKASYDLEILNIGSKRAVHPKVLLVSYFRTLHNPDKYYSHVRIAFNKQVEQNAKVLNNFLDRFESIKNNYYYSYNSFGEKVCAFFNKMFGIRK